VPASGIILNDLDRKKLQALKDSENRYLGAGPFSAAGNTLWNLPVVDTTSVASGTFFVGAFDIAAQLIDRMATEVIISTGDRDNFGSNTVTIRAEERVALAVKIEDAIVHGEYPMGVF